MIETRISASAATHNNVLAQIEQFNITDIDHRACGLRYLWRAVIAQSLIDALNQSKKLTNRLERARSIAWFSLNNSDFLTVCSYADLDPGYVMNKVKLALQQKTALSSK